MRSSTTRCPHAGSHYLPTDPAVGGSKRALSTWVGFVVAALMIIAIPVVTTRVKGLPTGDVHKFVIPAGTAARLADGEAVSILPPELEFEFRDRLVVVNHDSVTHHIASIAIGPGERVDARITDTISSGWCSIHPSGRIDIRVRGA